MTPIPFNRPALVGDELAYLREAALSGHLAGDGPFTRKCNALLEEIIGAKKVLLTTSCTHALEMAALLLDFRPGDEIIVPSFTFVSTLNAFVLRGARPVFADIRPDTLNIDETKIERLITPRTRAIVPVHYAGVACVMDAIMDIAARHRLEIIEDNAHGLFASWQGKALGTFGGLATQSFHETKNIVCGEGGALVVNDPRYFDRAEIIREKGTNRSRFFRGQVDKYTWVDVGSSYLPSELIAAFLLAQLEKRDAVQAKRRKVWEFYHQHLGGWAETRGITLPTIPEGCVQPFHLYYLLAPSLERRQALIAHLKSAGIQAVFHYLPLHLSDMGQKFGGKPGLCPVTEDVSDRLLRLPFFNDITEDDQARVVETVQKFFP
ncbi:MAG TPA: dTDP-4-amino-4,6-dideoxygalactose transaminase [Bacteroidota bacterium]|nr:dTDP-4-amino-4,6-dideoxygalactose transaminase [Bacteroidota bacterium]